MTKQENVTDDLLRIVSNYRKLCGYCDLVWEKVKQRFSAEVQCQKGCSACCELQSVNQLEAFLIRMHLETHDLKCSELSPGEDRCPFLFEQSCTIYEARPLICRTHGLVLKSRDFDSPSPSCPDNFKSLPKPELPQDLILDADIVTENLMRLNLAFCICTERDAEERISLAKLSEAV